MGDCRRLVIMGQMIQIEEVLASPPVPGAAGLAQPKTDDSW